MAINRATPRGTFVPPASPPPTLRDALRTIGPYSPGVNTERAAMSPQRQAEWAMAQAAPGNLSKILMGAMLAKPTKTNIVRPALDAYDLAQRGATPAELAAARVAYADGEGEAASNARPSGSAPPRDALLAAGMRGPTSYAHGIQGATVGRVNGKEILLPASGAANRAAFMSGMGALGQNPTDVGNVASVDRSRMARANRERRAAAAAMRAKLDYDLAIQGKKNEGEVEKERVKGEATIGAAQTKAERAAAQQRAKEEAALRGELGRMRGGSKAAYESYVRGVNAKVTDVFRRREQSEIDPEKKAQWKLIGGPEYRRMVAEQLAADKATDAQAFLNKRAWDYYESRLGTTPDSKWKLNVFDEMLPGARPTPPPNAPPPQAPPAAPPQQAAQPVVNPAPADEHGNDAAPPTPQEIATANPAQLDDMAYRLRTAAEHMGPGHPMAQEYLKAAALAEQRMASMGAHHGQ